VGLLAAKPGVQPPNNPPEWTSTPVISVAPGVGGTHDLKTNTFDQESDVLTFVKVTGTFEAWMSLDSGGVITITSSAITGTYTGFSFSADDGINSPVTSATFNIVVEDVTAWPAQDAWAGVVPAVRNRNGSGVTAAGRGFGMDTRHAYAQWNVSAQTGTSPTIVHVTTRDATGTGSLRNALEVSTGPRVIVFDLGGDFQFDQTVRMADGDIWLAGQTAPALVNILTDANFFQVRDGDIFFQHVSVWNNGDINDWTVQDIVRPRAMDMNDGASNNWSKVVIDHCFFGGATDQIFNLDEGDQITIIDSLIALPRGLTTFNHAYGGIWGDGSDPSTDVSSIGVVWAFNSRRCPKWQVENGTIANNLYYESDKAALELDGQDSDGFLTMTLNLVGNRWLDQPSDGEIFLYQTSLGDTLKTDSQLYLNDNLGPRFVSDEWDIVTDSDNQGSGSPTVRDDSLVTAAWPTGLVAAANRSVSEADFITLCTQNCGPRPNARSTYIQDIFDDVINSTGSQSDDYTAPTVTEVSTTFVAVSNPHQESGSTGRTNLEVQILDSGEGLLT